MFLKCHTDLLNVLNIKQVEVVRYAVSISTFTSLSPNTPSFSTDLKAAMCFYTGDLVPVDGMSTLAALVRVAAAPEVVVVS